MKNLVGWIKQEHQVFQRLMEKVAQSNATEPDTRLRLFNDAVKKLDAHGTAEEETLFPAMLDNALTKPAALEALEWHRSARHILTELIDMKPEDEIWLPKWLVTQGIIVAHIKIEEDVALNVLQKVFEPARIDKLNDDFYSVEEGVLKRETTGAYKMASKLKY